MIIKNRSESNELKLFRQLNLRMDLLENDKNYYLSLEKGYQGELAFDAIFDKINSNWLILNDLLLKNNNTTFQIDKAVISHEKIYLFEIKNFEGDYYLEGDKWFSISKGEIKSPFLQLQRSEASFRQLVNKIGFNFLIEPYLIFINPEFHLYNAPVNLPIIYPTQLNRFLNQLKVNKLILRNKHSSLAKQLSGLHINNSPFTQVPPFNYEQIRKGIICNSCGKFISDMTEVNLLVCSVCNHKESVENGVIRSVEDFNLLFPNEKITTNTVFEWCRVVRSKHIIRKTLLNNFDHVGWGKSSSFIKKL